MNKYWLLFGCIVILLSACQSTVSRVVPIPDESKIRETISTTVSNIPKINVEEVCGVVYQNDFVFGETSFSEAIEQLNQGNRI